ncbi:MAG: response regulator [Deltaproteobacteria bacterium]|nr:response regulator [Deltaproteobacteria bacterium]
MNGHDILLIEDNDELRSAIKDLFELDGFTALEACHGAQAIDILKKPHNISLIFMDLNMPVMSGEEFLRSAKELKLVENIKIIVFATKIPKALSDEYQTLKKPAEIDELLNLAKSFCDRPNAGPAFV